MGLLPREQAGGRKHQRADIVCACKTLMWDIVRQKRIPASLSSVDATTCYDRILYSVALLCTLKWGIAFNAMICMLHCLLMMETSVKTAHGISSQKYGTLHDHLPHHGMGQGNGGGPPIYDTVSAMIITIMTSLGFGTRFLSPILRNELKYTGFEYVDDGDLSLIHI